MNDNDYLKYTNLKIAQDENGFKVNTDTTLLGMFLDLKKDKSVLDIGTNNGALLMYASFFKPRLMYGIDIFDKALEYANINLKNYDNVILEKVDLKDFKCFYVFDYIICNPPFFENCTKRKNAHYQLAMYEDSMSLETIFSKAKSLLKENGTIFFLYPANCLNKLFDVIYKKGFRIEVMQFVYDENKEFAIRVLLKIRKKTKNISQLKILKPIEIKRKTIKNIFHQKYLV